MWQWCFHNKKLFTLDPFINCDELMIFIFDLLQSPAIKKNCFVYWNHNFVLKRRSIVSVTYLINYQHEYEPQY